MTRLALLLALLPSVACAEPMTVVREPQGIHGPMVHVRDGDTLEILDRISGRVVAVRLNGLHAPELREPGGREARRWMQIMTTGEVVTCTLTGERSRDRLVGICYLNGADLAAGLVGAGLGRDCPRYSRGRYRALERPEAAAIPLPSYCVRRPQ